MTSGLHLTEDSISCFALFALGQAAAAEYHFVGTQANDVFRSFFAQAGICAGDDDGLGSKGSGGNGDFEDQLGMNEVAEGGHVCGAEPGSLGSLTGTGLAIVADRAQEVLIPFSLSAERT